MESKKKWVMLSLTLSVVTLMILGGITFIIDPFFHYHPPTTGYHYSFMDKNYEMDERYINDGIVRHFDYNAIITGTSMTENFKTSEFDDLFGVNSIKIPFSGGTYKEINECLERAYGAGKNIDIIIRSLDLSSLILM